MQVESRILKLDNHLINQIAAGEVVERPASALKEIIENSIDANATEISIDLENGGKTLIRVADNGSGLLEDDLPLVFERHATSKITSLADLENNLNLGFRGEALAAISSVSQIEFASRHHTKPHGCSIDSNGQISSKAMNIGTTVTVRDLFYNTVARQKYLKSDSTEYKNCIQVITHYLLAHPNLAFRVTHNSKLIYKLPIQTPKQRIEQIFSSEFFDQLIPVSYFDEQIKLSGFICRPQAAIAKMPTQLIFVNKRPINSKSFAHAITQSYGSWLFSPQKPQFLLYFDIDPKTVDMNIHPRKLEAKFFLESKIYGILRQVTRKTLESHSLTPSVSKSDSLAKFVPGYSENFKAESKESTSSLPSFSDFKPSQNNPGAFSYGAPRSNAQINSNIFSSHDRNYSLKHDQLLAADPDYLVPKDQLDSSTLNLETSSEDGLRAVCQIKNSYIIAEGPNDIFIVDQHAAHERIWYEILKQNAHSKTPNSQPLLVSETFSLELQHLETLNKAKSTLESLGFNFIVKDSTLIVKAIPSNLSKINIKELFINILEDIETNHNFTNLNELEDIVINYTACRTAIKFGQKLELVEMQKLLDDMQQISHKKYTCPHGRPALIKLGMNDLEKLFKRIH